MHNVQGMVFRESQSIEAFDCVVQKTSFSFFSELSDSYKQAINEQDTINKANEERSLVRTHLEYTRLAYRARVLDQPAYRSIQMESVNEVNNHW